MTERRCRSCPDPLPSRRAHAAIRWGLLLLVLVVLVVLHGATAARAASPSCQSDSVCRAEFKRASELYLRSDYEGALAAFRAAHARQAEPRILLNIGRTLYKLDRPEEALNEYQRCWNGAAPGDRDLFKTLDQYMSEARDLLARQRQAARKTESPAPATSGAGDAADAAAGKASPAISQADNRKPIYKRAWFWAVIGGVAAAGIVAGAVAGTAARASGPEPLPHHISF